MTLVDEHSDAAAREGRGALAVLLALVAVVASLVAVGFGMRAIDESKQGAVGDAAEGAAYDGPPAVFEVSLTEFSVTPASVTVEAGQAITLNVTNNGATAHDLKLDGRVGTAMLAPGAKETVTLDGMKTSGEAWCTVPGHKAAGMVMKIEVKGASGGATAAGSDKPAASNAAKFDPNAKPAADWKPYDPTLKPAPGGVEHKIDLKATEQEIEVAPGVKQMLWTFGGQVPGPVLRGKVGDVFTVTLTNGGAIDHSIDFHASKVAWNDEMRSIKPGESLVYQYQAKHSGVFMYHCGTAPTLHHIGNGMYGAVVIDPPGLPPVDHEYVFVQSEFYLGPQGEAGDLTKMQNEQWDMVVFNGYASQYLHKPIRVEPGQRVRTWVLNAGPSENSSYHIVGTIFDTMFKEGAYTLRPGAASGGAQALDLQPAQGGFVEFTFDEAGLYPIVTHKFANPGKGALGLFQAGEVKVPEGASH